MINKKKPNLIFLFPDQMRSDFLRCYGANFIETPNIDSLAKNGIRYSNAYSSSPVCVPARSSLMTGMDAISNGILSNSPAIRPDHKEAGIKTWPETLRDSGYYTSAIGKMHFYPWTNKNGFMYRSTTEDKRWLKVRDDYYYHLKGKGHKKYHGNEHEGYHENFGAINSKVKWEDSWDHFVGNEACKFINEYGKEKPFAMMVGFPGPHDPYDPSEDFHKAMPDENKMPTPIKGNPNDAEIHKKNMMEGWKYPWADLDYEGLTESKIKKMRAHYAALIQQIDYEVGQIIESLKKNNLYDDSIIIFSSDHGDFLGDHGMMGKANFYESAMRVPLIVSGKSIDSNIVDKNYVCLRDITSTILSLSGNDIPFYMDSIPLPQTPADNNKRRKEIFGFLANGVMVFDGRYKLVRYSTGEDLLFDLQEDPTEENNIIEDVSKMDILDYLDDLLVHRITLSRKISMHSLTSGGTTLTTDPVNPKVYGYQFEGWEWDYPTNIDTPVTKSYYKKKWSI